MAGWAGSYRLVKMFSWFKDKKFELPEGTKWLRHYTLGAMVFNESMRVESLGTVLPIS